MPGIWDKPITGLLNKDSINVMFPSLRIQRIMAPSTLAKASWNKLF